MSDDGTMDDGTTESVPRRWPLLVGLVVVAGGLVAALFLFDGDDAGAPTATSDPSSTPATSEPATSGPATTGGTAVETMDATTVAPTGPASTAPATTDATPPTGSPATTESTEPEQPESAMWPWAVTGTRFDAPVDAATSFATDFLGFTDPVVGEFQAGDARSGEVEIRPRSEGEVTVVFVRQLTDDDSWWVLGSAAEGIVIDEPDALAVVESPLTVSGSARAFEGTVDVQLRADGNGEPIASSFVTGGAGPDLEPFEGSVEFTSPGDLGGALVLRSVSPEDGSVVEASAVRVSYAG